MTTTNLSQVRETIALLNSMVMCGEDHSDHSRAMVRKALATIDANAAPVVGDGDAEAAAYAAWRGAVLATAAARAVPRGSGEEAKRRDDAYWRATLAQADAFRALHAAVERAVRPTPRDDGEAR